MKKIDNLVKKLYKLFTGGKELKKKRLKQVMLYSAVIISAVIIYILAVVINIQMLFFQGMMSSLLIIVFLYMRWGRKVIGESMNLLDEGGALLHETLYDISENIITKLPVFIRFSLGVSGSTSTVVDKGVEIIRMALKRLLPIYTAIGWLTLLSLASLSIAVLVGLKIFVGVLIIFNIIFLFFVSQTYMPILYSLTEKKIRKSVRPLAIILSVLTCLFVIFLYWYFIGYGAFALTLMVFSIYCIILLGKTYVNMYFLKKKEVKGKEIWFAVDTDAAGHMFRWAFSILFGFGIILLFITKTDMGRPLGQLTINTINDVTGWLNLTNNKRGYDPGYITTETIAFHLKSDQDKLFINVRPLAKKEQIFFTDILKDTLTGKVILHNGNGGQANIKLVRIMTRQNEILWTPFIFTAPGRPPITEEDSVKQTVESESKIDEPRDVTEDIPTVSLLTRVEYCDVSEDRFVVLPFYGETGKCLIIETASGNDFYLKTASYGTMRFRSGSTLEQVINYAPCIVKKTVPYKETFILIPQG